MSWLLSQRTDIQLFCSVLESSTSVSRSAHREIGPNLISENATRVFPSRSMALAVLLYSFLLSMYITRPNLWAASSMCTTTLGPLGDQKHSWTREFTQRSACIHNMFSEWYNHLRTALLGPLAIVLFSCEAQQAKLSRVTYSPSLCSKRWEIESDLRTATLTPPCFRIDLCKLCELWGMLVVGVASVRVRTLPVFISNTKTSSRLELNARSSASSIPEANVVGIRVTSRKGANLRAAAAAEAMVYV